MVGIVSILLKANWLFLPLFFLSRERRYTNRILDLLEKFCNFSSDGLERSRFRAARNTSGSHNWQSHFQPLETVNKSSYQSWLANLQPENEVSISVANPLRWLVHTWATLAFAFQKSDQNYMFLTTWRATNHIKSLCKDVRKLCPFSIDT